MCSLSPRGCHEGDVHVVLRFQHSDANHPIAPDPSTSFTAAQARRERPPLRRIAQRRGRFPLVMDGREAAPYTGDQGPFWAIPVMWYRLVTRPVPTRHELA